MAIRNASTKNAIRNGIINRTEFEAPATLTGTWEDGPLYMGRLSGDAQARMREDTRGAHIVYVVRSYKTPIAWYVAGRGWSQANETFSNTTTNHQAHVAAAIAETV